MRIQTLTTLVVAFFLCTTSLCGQEHDTASVIFLPLTGDYLLQYTYDGVSYVDTLEPATKIDPAVFCSVNHDSANMHYEYRYSVTLRSTSRQYLSTFGVEHEASIQVAHKPNSTWTMGEIHGKGVWDWANDLIDPSGLWTPTKDIAPGGSMEGFSFQSNGPPKIVNSYFQGNAAGVVFTGESSELLQDLLAPIRDFPNDHVTRTTIGPTPPPSIDPFGSIWFTDTLISYTTRSRALNWILSQPTSDKYIGIFTRVKADLQQNDKASAQARLDTVLQQVPIDSAANLLTSEAYALLRFNTVYLKTMIPVDPLPVQLYYFTAEPQQDRSVLVEWGTLSETNNYGFEVQKKLSTAPTYTTFTFVAGHGTTQVPHQYSATDTNTTEGTWHYRLKQVDLDGTPHYTGHIVVIISPVQSGVQWSYFNASVQLNGKVLVEWGTLSETNNEGFEVQKRFDEWSEYRALTYESGNGTTTEPHDYFYEDKETDYGTWYYRIKQISSNGQTSFTDSLKVTIKYTVVEEKGLAATTTDSQKVTIDWTTLREEGNSHFEVQVSRNDSVHYWTLHGSRIKGAGNSRSRRQYQYSQRIPNGGTWYFRLKQTATDGEVRYSRSVRAKSR